MAVWPSFSGSRRRLLSRRPAFVESVGQQVVEGRLVAVVAIFRVDGDHAHRRAEFGQELATRAAGTGAAGADDGDGQEIAVSGRDRGRSRHALGANRQAVGGIFDVGALINLTAGGADRRSDCKVRIRRRRPAFGLELPIESSGCALRRSSDSFDYQGGRLKTIVADRNRRGKLVPNMGCRFRWGEDANQRLARFYEISEANEHFEARRVIDRVAKLLSATAEFDDHTAERFGVDCVHETGAETPHLRGGCHRARRIEIAALGRNHFAELGQAGARVDHAMKPSLRSIQIGFSLGQNKEFGAKLEGHGH